MRTAARASGRSTRARPSRPPSRPPTSSRSRTVIRMRTGRRTPRPSQRPRPPTRRAAGRPMAAMPTLASMPVGRTRLVARAEAGDQARHAVRAGARARRVLPRAARPRVRGDPARLGRPDHGPRRRLHAADPRDLGVRVAVAVPPQRDGVPDAQPLDARVRRRPLQLAAVPGAAPRARACRAAGDELVRPTDGVRGRDDPRRRGGDRDAGAAHRRGRRARPAPGSGSRCSSRSASGSSRPTRSSSSCRRPGSSRARSGGRCTSRSGCWRGRSRIAVGLAFLMGTESLLPDITQFLGGGL